MLKTRRFLLSSLPLREIGGGGSNLGGVALSLVALLESDVSLLDEAEADASLGEDGDEGLLALANDEHVGRAGGERVACGVLDVGDVEAAGVLLDVLEHADSADVVAADDDHLGAVLVLDNAFDFACLEVKLYDVIFNIKIIQKSGKKERRLERKCLP